MDLIAFLKSVFESFTNLPSRLAGMACMSSCQHLARSIMNIIMDESVKAVSEHIYCLLESIAGTSFDAAEAGPQAHNFMNHSL